MLGTVCVPLFSPVSQAAYTTPCLSIGVAVIRRSNESTHRLQLGWSAATTEKVGLPTNGLVGTYAPVKRGAAPPWSWPVGLVIRQRARPEHESAAPPPKKPQKWPLTGSGPSRVSTNT